jgi:hypothetical protein
MIIKSAARIYRAAGVPHPISGWKAPFGYSSIPRRIRE